MVKKTRKESKKPLSIITSAIMIAIAAVLCVATVIGHMYSRQYADLISVYFNQPQTKIVSTGDKNTQHFASSYKSDAEREKALKEFGSDILREGSTLLINQKNALPLKSSAKITVLGQSFVDPVYGGGGAGSIDVKKAINFETAFEQAGLQVNPTVTEFYKTGAGRDYRKTVPDVFGRGKLAVNEVPVNLYTDEVKNSFDEYKDAAVVVIGRTGSESSDLSTKTLESGSTYLQLDKDEQELLDMARNNFSTVVVILNTQNAVELGSLVEKKVDAALWVGGLGQTGAIGVADVLTGQTNPSGHLPDTYAYDSQSAPSIHNFGRYSIANSQVERGNAYIAYQEGIYVGYRYYETRYEDAVLGNEKAGAFNYEKQVQFPFGYGLSYTSFEWSNFAQSESKDGYDFSIDVKNTGKVAGKDVVQLYMQSPYTDYDKRNHIEKSAVELVGYAKTAVIEPGKSETVSVHVSKEAMKSYDAYGKGTYIVDAGDFYFTAATDAHAAVNNILATKSKSTADGMTADGRKEFVVKKVQQNFDDTTYAKSVATGQPVVNQFADADITTYDSSAQYLSRSDWEGTWPRTYADGSWTAPDDFVKALEIDTTVTQPKATPRTGQIDKSLGKLNMATLMKTDSTDKAWTAAIEQMSVQELDELVRIGGYATKSADSTQLPATVDKDGPAGISSTLVGGENGVGYAPEVVVAATWNTDLARDFGEAIGEDSIALKVAIWYGAAANIHRSPYSGRNFEYFSEDPHISGAMNAAIVAGARSKGAIATVKHFALNDQETNRTGGAMLANEQSIRDLYLKPFEMSVRDGGALGMMASMNRIGARWTGGSKALMTNVLRGEWGFEGFVVTDQASYSVFAYEDLREGLEAGTDLWLNTDAKLWKLDQADMADGVVAHMQRAAKNISFAISRSNAMNGLANDSTIVRVTPLWMWGVYAVETVVAILCLALLSVAARDLYRHASARKKARNNEED
ncbi:glycoside hydrolase family 3 protein [Alloscardovia omnicolens]|uniref:glycoside hydrolase family 3 protein n=1 Tax=Alloscardovia omnicolens TaxID=419015 RepID=UPI00069E7C7B|nr:glycoside hydrolase family 3 protein [Alloscardovia omnicolens]